MISSARPLPTRLPETSTRDSGGENAVALSVSSAMRWIRSATTLPRMRTSGSLPVWMRV
ncbi:Uncharacterised protein [Mycobacteroides abscessus subsp. abscessus]|nr:Uncharacterised protein [Mycobacteroides abscessus subsp. abscessus]